MWDTKKFGEICNFVRGPFGGSLKKSFFKPDGFAVYEQQHAIYDQFTKIRYFVDEDKFNEMKRFELKSGDLIMSCSGTMGKIAIVPNGIKQGIINQALLKLTPLKSADIHFLKYWMSSPNFQGEIERLSQGAAIKNVASVKVLKNIEAPIPPLEEQKRIVEILDEAFRGIDAAIANTEKNLTNARELFESTFVEIFPCPRMVSQTEPLSNLCEFIVDCEHKTAPKQLKGIPSIRTPNIGFGELLLENVNRVSEETYEIWTRRGKPQTGDLILAREAPAGNIAVVPEGEKVCLGQRTVLLRPKHDIIFSGYLAYLILHPTMQKKFLDHSTGATVQHINMKDIRAFPIGELPSIMAQKEAAFKIKELLDKRQNLETTYLLKLVALRELKQSLLQKAFSGELTSDVRKVA